jgi:hypothetical protein
MKDRRGPGIMTVSTAGGEGGLAEAVFGWSEESEGEAPLIALPEEQAHRQIKAEREMANVRRRHFIIGYLCENLPASLTGP